jgi:DNA-binding phage protein
MATSTFWTDHDEKLADPEYAAAFARESRRVAAVDRIVGKLDEYRVMRGLPKTHLARAIGMGDAALRRLFTKRASANPTLGTVEEIAFELGYRVTLEPIPAGEPGSKLHPTH